jgi:RNA polymerase sigma-70 factor (ECF subfamily)
MAAYVAGDDYAFAELFRSYAPILTRFFMRQGKRNSDAQDLVQQTFLHVHRARYDYRAGEALRPWLFTIARNAGHDHGRRQKRRPEAFCDLDLHEAPEPAHDELMHAERTRIVASALAGLKPSEKKLLDEHWLQERSWNEIAARDGVHAATLRVRAHRACTQLRACIQFGTSAAA